MEFNVVLECIENNERTARKEIRRRLQVALFEKAIQRFEKKSISVAVDH